MAPLESFEVGCFSLIQIKDTIYELVKMAVDSKHKDLNIGQKLPILEVI